MMKKKFVSALAVTLSLSVLAACGQTPAGSGSQSSADPGASASVSTPAPPMVAVPTVQPLPDAATTTYTLDLQNQAKQYYYGMYEQVITLPDSTERTMKLYCPQGTRRDCYAIFVAVPSEVDTAIFLAESGWLSIADEAKQIIVAFEPEGRSWGDETAELDYLAAAYSGFTSNTYFYSYGQDFRFIGYGDGGSLLQKFIMKNPMVAAALVVVDGSGDISSDYLTEVGNTPFSGFEITCGETPVPVWIVETGNEQTAAGVADYWCSANDCLDAYSTLSDGSQLYCQDPYSNSPFTYNQKVGTVRVTKRAMVYTDSDFAEEAFDFAMQFARTGAGNPYSNVLKAAVDESSFLYTTKEVDGILREWYTYLPTGYSEGDEAMPVVIYLHGNGQSGLMSMRWADWWMLGEEKGFITVCPSSALSYTNGKIPLMSWNTTGVTEDRADDIAFIATLVEELKNTYRVDESRIYITGQSNGGAMSGVIAMTLPELFAAQANTGAPIVGGAGVEKPQDLNLPVNHDYEIPTFLMLGEYDKDQFIPGEETSVSLQLDYFADRYGIDTASYGSYVNGTYKNYLWHDDKSVPMMRLTTVSGRAHSWRPEEVRVIWNEWFALFSRSADGDVIYLGK